jgi:hypothetical protein
LYVSSAVQPSISIEADRSHTRIRFIFSFVLFTRTKSHSSFSPANMFERRHFSLHGTEITATKKTHYQRGRRISKPIAVQDYNENRELVDKSDMQISFSESLRKSLKWYKKLFFHLLDISLYNACVLYKLQTGRKSLFPIFD